MKQYTRENELHKLESFKRLINLTLSGISLGIEIIIFTYFWYVYFVGSLQRYLGFFEKSNWLQICIYAAILFFTTQMYGGLRIGYLKNIEIIFSKIIAVLISNVLIYAQISIMAQEFFILSSFAKLTIYQILGIIVWTNIENKIYCSVFPPRKLLMVHGRRPIEDILKKFQNRKDKYKVIKCIHINNTLPEIKKEIIKGYEEGDYTAVVLWDISVEDRNELLKFCYARSIRVYIMPKITDVILIGAEELHLFDTPILLTREYRLTMEQRFIKRCIDLFCAILLFIITSPFMLITAIAIKLYDGGPIFYKQIRCTVGQKEFNIMKFRSMYTDAEKDGVARLATKNDDRITPIGKFIRKVRIDELPQLFNIIRGEMSFIGPRPERPEIIAQYVEIMPEFAFRMKVKAGLAGYAQVFGKYNTTPYDKLKLDLTYIENYSIWLDMKLMLLTLKILFWPDSTEGVECEQVTAFKEEFDRKQ